MGARTPLDKPTLLYATAQLAARLHAVETYGAGGCASCHDAELRGAIVMLKRLLEPEASEAATVAAAPARRSGRR